MENINMKTGFDNIFSNNKNIDNNNLSILSLLTIFMENSITNAAIYTKHSNRKIITSKDISLSLKREVFEFLNSDNLETRAKELLDEYIEEFNNYNSDEEYDEEEEDEEEDEEYDEENDDEEDNKKKENNSTIESNDKYNKEYDDEEFIESTCNCDICSQMNKYNNIWKHWKPTNKIEEILYNGIIKIDNNFNLN